jgi:hypothetical protein
VFLDRHHFVAVTESKAANTMTGTGGNSEAKKPEKGVKKP